MPFLNCGGVSFSLAPLSGHDLAQITARVRTRTLYTGDFTPLRSTGQEKPKRPGEVFRGQALEPDHESQPPAPPAFVHWAKVVPALACPQGHADTKVSQCQACLLSSPFPGLRGAIVSQGGMESQYLPRDHLGPRIVGRAAFSESLLLLQFS